MLHVLLRICREVFAELVPGGKGELVMQRRRQVCGWVVWYLQQRIRAGMQTKQRATTLPRHSMQRTCSMSPALLRQWLLVFFLAVFCLCPTSLHARVFAQGEEAVEEEEEADNVAEKYVGVNVSANV